MPCSGCLALHGVNSIFFKKMFYFSLHIECLILKFDDIPVSVTLNGKRICQVALTCLDEIEQLISNYHVMFS